MQEISKVGRLKSFLAQRKALASLSVDTTSAKDQKIVSPGSSPLSPIETCSPIEHVSLRQALSNSALHKMLIEYTQKEFKYDRVLVWDNIQRFKKASEQELRLDVARFIYDTFLSSNDAGVSESICKTVQVQLANNYCYASLFDELEKLVESDLEVIFDKFIKSTQYVEYMRRGGKSLVVVDRLTLIRRPSLQKLSISRNPGLVLDIEEKREMSPTVGSSERFVGSPTVLVNQIKSPNSIKSPTVGDTARFVCIEQSCVSSTVETIKEQEKLQHHKRVASPRDFLASLLSFKRRKL